MVKLVKNWWLLLIAGIAYIVLGILVWRHPGETILVAAIYIGIILLITGISQAILAIRERDGLEKWGWYLAIGLIDIFLGGIFLFNPISTAVALTLVIGIWFLFRGILEFVNSFSLKSKGVDLWWISMFGGLILAILGFIIVGKPLAGTMAIVTLISVAFWLKGIIMIVMSFGLKKVKGTAGDVKQAVSERIQG
jgi:uncharacterized membrane protein HdeD (DUF308 family)